MQIVFGSSQAAPQLPIVAGCNEIQVIGCDFDRKLQCRCFPVELAELQNDTFRQGARANTDRVKMLNLGQCSFDFLLSGGWCFVEAGEDVSQPCLEITVIID